MREAASRFGEGSCSGVQGQIFMERQHRVPLAAAIITGGEVLLQSEQRSSGSSPYCARIMFCSAMSHFMMRTSVASKYSCGCAALWPLMVLSSQLSVLSNNARPEGLTTVN